MSSLLSTASSPAAFTRTAPALYRPRWPERTLLHSLVREHLETFLALARQGQAEMSPVPGYVETTFRKYLECGVPSFGFARARCSACGYDFFVAFSCQTKGICPSCNTRRMVETAAHLAFLGPATSGTAWIRVGASVPAAAT